MNSLYSREESIKRFNGTYICHAVNTVGPTRRDPARKTYTIAVYSEKLLMMDR